MTFVMVPAAILCYRDDTGKSVAEKLAAKAKVFPTKPVLGTFLVMFAIINVSYFAYGGVVLRLSRPVVRRRRRMPVAVPRGQSV